MAPKNDKAVATTSDAPDIVKLFPKELQDELRKDFLAKNRARIMELMTARADHVRKIESIDAELKSLVSDYGFIKQ